MTPAEKRATDAVVRAAKRWVKAQPGAIALVWGHAGLLVRAVSRLLREEAKRKGGKRG